jgi:sec-independent protein translocase protein TatB
MPQIGWLEILIVVILAILIIGPKDFPLMLKKLGSWISTFKNYFSQVQEEIIDLESNFDNDLSVNKDLSQSKKDKKKDE